MSLARVLQSGKPMVLPTTILRVVSVRGMADDKAAPPQTPPQKPSKPVDPLPRRAIINEFPFKFDQPHPLEHATGWEKMLLLAAEKGIDDPLQLKPVKRVADKGTKDKPYEVQCYEEKRIVGCQCEEDQTHINYMWIWKGENKRCYCGHWFKGVEPRKWWEEIDYTPGVTV